MILYYFRVHRAGVNNLAVALKLLVAVAISGK
jgi:hypothetical protein